MKKSIRVLAAAMVGAAGLGAGIFCVQAQTCPVEGCTQTGEHTHYSCGVEDCTQISVHTHKQHNSGHRNGGHH